MSAEHPATRKPLIIGFLIGGAVILGLSMFSQSIRNAPESVRVIPPRTFVMDSTALTNPVSLRFVTTGALQLTSMGWAADGLHLHVVVDSVAIMAGPSELTSVAADTFLWTLPPVSAGAHDVRLFWADERHIPIGDTVSRTIQVIR